MYYTYVSSVLNENPVAILTKPETIPQNERPILKVHSNVIGIMS